MRSFAYHASMGYEMEQQIDWQSLIRSHFFLCIGTALKEGQTHNPEPHRIWQTWYYKQGLLVSQKNHSDMLTGEHGKKK